MAMEENHASPAWSPARQHLGARERCTARHKYLDGEEDSSRPMEPSRSEPDKLGHLNAPTWAITQHLRTPSGSAQLGADEASSTGAGQRYPDEAAIAGSRKAGVFWVHLPGPVSPFPFPIHIPPSQLPVSVLGPKELPLLITVQNGLLVSAGDSVGGWSSQPKGQPQREGEEGSVPLEAGH